MNNVKLSDIITLADDFKFHDQEMRSPWMNADFIGEHTTKRNKAHTKLIKNLLKLLDNGSLEIDV